MRRKSVLLVVTAALLMIQGSTVFASDASDAIIIEDDIVETELPVTEESDEDIPALVVEEVEESTGDDTEEEDSLIQLAIPTNLVWGLYNDSEIPGVISWYATTPTQNSYRVCVYQVNANGEDWEVYGCTHNYSSTMELGQTQDLALLLEKELEAGTYYFTVQAMGDGTTYSDSEIAVSEYWIYQPADEKLDTPTSPALTAMSTDTSIYYDADLMFSWDYDEITNVFAFECETYYSEMSSNIEDMDVICTSYFYSIYSEAFWDMYKTLSLENINHDSTGYYIIRVRALPRDMTSYQKSDYSDYSEAYYYVSDNEDVAETLSEIRESGASGSEVKEAVQQIDTSSLASAMESDTSNDGVVAQIADLEVSAGSSTVVTVTEDMESTFDVNEITVVGASLNTSSGDATLTIGKINDEDVIPTQVQNAIGFSMSLTGDGVEITELSVPVKITLPVPSTINPEFLVILHYHQDGTKEQVFPYIYADESGQYYASFVITSFSDFVMYDSSTAVTDISGCTLTLSASSYTYDGTAKEPTVTVKNGDTTLIEGTDYSVKYSNNTETGTATVTITGMGDYTGTITATFTISVETESEKKTESDSETETETEQQSETETETEVKNGLTLNEADGIWYYYVNDVIDTAFSGIATYQGGQFFVANGVLCNDSNGLNLYDGVWYFLANGQIQTQYTGLALYDGEWFYITDGVLDTSKNGLVAYDGERFLVAEGQLLLTYNGLWQNAGSIGGDDLWYFIGAGMVQNVSQVVMYDGAWFVVENGILDSDYNGTIEYDGTTFTVVAGQLYE